MSSFCAKLARMNIRWTFAILIILAVGVFLIFGRRHEAPLNERANVVGSPAPVATAAPVQASTPVPVLGTSTAKTENFKAPKPDEAPFKQRLEDLSSCLQLRDIKPGPDSPILSFATLNNSLVTKFGGLKQQSDLWASTEIQTPTGARRRLLADFRQEQPSLHYLEIQPDGTQKDLELTPEQSADPSESLIASLEADGKILAKARERLISYQNGQTIQVREVEGQVYSFTVQQGAKSYSCTRDTEQDLNCTCTE